MAFYSFLCGLTLMTIFSFGVCHPKYPACGKMPQGHHLPWQVVLTIDGKHKCLGSLLNSNMVLTDLHCKIGPLHQIAVSLGHMDMSNPIKTSEKLLTVEDAACSVPPLTSPLKGDGICVLTLSHPVNFTDTMYPICLPSGDSNFYTGMESFVATGLMAVPTLKAPLIGYHVCKCYSSRVQSHMFCAGEDWEFGSQKDCPNDLGGALMLHHHNCVVQIGMVAYDPYCPTPSSARSYINMASFAKFIKNVTHSDPPCMIPVQPGEKHPESNYVCPTSEPPMPPKPPKCTNPPTADCEEESIFGSGVNIVSSSGIILLCILVFTFYSTH